MKHHIRITALALPALITPITRAQESVDDKGTIAGSAIVTGDFTLVRDASVTPGLPALKKLDMLDFVNIPSFFGTVSKTELEYLDGVTSSVQTQLNSKATDTAVVKLTGAQTIAGNKTFTGILAVSDTTTGPYSGYGGFKVRTDVAADEFPFFIPPSVVADQTLAVTANDEGIPDKLYNASISGTLTAGSLSTDATTKTNLRLAMGLGIISTTTYTSGSGTINLPTGATHVSIRLQGGGGGGGSGRRGAAGTARTGGGGGGGGGFVSLHPTPVSTFTFPMSYSIGTGGTGASGQTADDTNGNTGTAGTATTCGPFTAVAGAAGGGGQQSAQGAGGANVVGGCMIIPGFISNSLGGGNSSATGQIGVAGAVNQLFSPVGGASGGGMTTGNVANHGIAGNGVGSAASYNTAGGSYDSSTRIGGPGATDAITLSGSAGAGGGATGTTGSAGGDGGSYGGGGGGGGAALNGNNSGAGGSGAGGAVTVTFYY